MRTRIDTPGGTAFNQTVSDQNQAVSPSGASAPPREKAVPPEPPPRPEQRPAEPSPLSTNVDHDRDRDTHIVCDSCGAVQLDGGLFCTTCGEELSALALARKRSREPRRAIPSLTLITEGGQDGRVYKLDREDTIIGRSEGEITFPHDGFMSGRHARIIEREGRYFLVDENSRNGTFIRINSEVTLETDDRILIGKQIFQLVIEK
ncbi:MAG: FHA domain-containing protein [Blastocatellia bacterium]|nr:FHA domain-containing protein [Blastocatellia bacterium]